MWKVVTSSHLNPPLKLFFYSPILTNNNLLLKIYCENIVVTFLNYDFLFFILFLLSLISFHPYVFLFFFFFFLVFLFHTRCPISIPPFFYFLLWLSFSLLCLSASTWFKGSSLPLAGFQPRFQGHFSGSMTLLLSASFTTDALRSEWSESAVPTLPLDFTIQLFNKMTPNVKDNIPSSLLPLDVGDRFFLLLSSAANWEWPGT